MNIVEHIKNKIAVAAGVEVEKIRLEHPELAEYGDFSTNIALSLKGGRKLAEELILAIKPDEVIAKVEVAGPGFVNIWLQSACLVNVFDEVLNQAQSFGRKNSGEGRRVIIDYSAPNIAKPFGIGHLRSTIIGQAIYNLYHFLGYEAIGDNHLGDWGTQFGKLLYMIELEKPEKLDIETLEVLYVKFHQLAQTDPSLEGKAREWFKKLEDKDDRALSLWRECWEVSMVEFNRIYELLGVNIDEVLGESFYEDKMAAVIAQAKALGVAHESEGALVIDIPGMKVPMMLLKSDGATTYATRDLATIVYRMQRWSPAIMIYEVGAEQGLHFAQVFAAAKQMGYVDDAVKLVHTGHGLYLDTDGKKFSTRKGKTVKLEEVLIEAIERAKQLGSVDIEVAKKVGIGAVKYFDLKHGVQSDIVFDWEKMFELQGNSGPYLQYTYARTRSVAAKAASLVASPNIYEQFNEEELAIMRWVYRFPEVIEEAALRYSPNLLCNYLFELAQRYNTFYNKHSILTPETGGEEARDFRLKLTAVVGQVMANGLRILGIEVPERM